MDDYDLLQYVRAWAAMRKSVSRGAIIRAFRIGARKADQIYSYMLVTGEIDSAGRVNKEEDQICGNG